MSTISKRELLSFCQLANLDWQFYTEAKKKNLMLSEALNPNYFRRTKKDIYGEIIKIDKVKYWENIAIYGEDEEGRIALRKKIGMTMELLEKKESGSKEGSYLDEWEVLGGYDNYLIEQEEMEKELLGGYDNYLIEQEEMEKELKANQTLVTEEYIIKMLEVTDKGMKNIIRNMKHI